MIDWNKYVEKLNKIEEMSCVPNFCKMNEYTVIDENKTVKWNREQVAINNNNYHKEVTNLNIAKKVARESVMEDIFKEIQESVGHKLTRDKAMLLWDYAYSEAHSGGYRDVFNTLDYLMELADKLLTK